LEEKNQKAEGKPNWKGKRNPEALEVNLTHFPNS
jgi:hypothetical protein